MMRRLLAFSLLLACGSCGANAPFVSTGSGWLSPLIYTGAPAVTNLPLGMNLAAVAYYSPEQPFINLMKSAGSSSQINGGANGWYTASSAGTTPTICPGNSGYFDTCEEPYLQLDSDGFVTSLTASPTPGGGQVFNEVYTLMNYNMPSVPAGVTYPYPAGQYRLKFEGQGTLQVTVDSSVQSGDTCAGGVTLSNSSANTYVSCTFHVLTPSTGLKLYITAITNGTDHPRDISIMLESNAASYDAGAIFNPLFLAQLQNISNLRFMEWKNTNGEFSGQAITAALSSGATSFTLTSTWGLPSGTYPIIFIDGETRNATFTLGSASVTWTGGLSNSIGNSPWTWQSDTNYGSGVFLIGHTWANRSKPSNAFWDLVDGVPLEVILALCNQLGTGCHVNVPLMYSDSDIESMGQLVMQGTGMQSGYSALGSSHTGSFEISNEIWNTFNFPQGHLAGSLGQVQWPGQSGGGSNVTWQQQYLGMRTAQMASDLQSTLGSTIFARVNPVLGGWLVNTSYATNSLGCSYWASAPCSGFPIKSYAVNPYWSGAPNSSDCNHMVGVTTPLDDLFATLTSETGTVGNGSYSYTSVGSTGLMGYAEGYISAFVSFMASYPNQHLIGYEGGQNFLATTGLSGGSCSGWPALVTAAERDARMGTATFNYLNFWKTTVGATSANVFNYFNDITGISNTSAFGAMESVMQPISPLSSAPPKYQAVQDYATQ